MATSPMKPSIGRIVLMHAPTDDYAAIISELDEHNPDGVVTLHVFYPKGGVRTQVGVPYGQAYTGGNRWSWPPKVG